MAISLDTIFSSSLLPFIVLLYLLCFIDPCTCFNRKVMNSSYYAEPSGWSTAGATWYGAANGAGSDGGACAFGSAVDAAPFSSLIAAGNPTIFRSGAGCGECYQVKCTENRACSGNPVTVVITDECPPGGPCTSEYVHFDMSGTAFGAMAIYGQAERLRNAGYLHHVQYRRVECNYQGTDIVFRVDAGSNPYYFAVVIEYEDADGDLKAVDLKPSKSSPWSNNNGWISMERSWGVDWCLRANSVLQPPFSLRLTSQSGKKIIANNVIPAGWQPGSVYKSVVNYNV